MSEKHQAFSLVITLIFFVVVLFMDFSTVCSLHVFFCVFVRFIFEDWLAKGHAGAAAWLLHIIPTAFFRFVVLSQLYKDFIKIKKKTKICTKSVEVVCIESIMLLFHFEHWALLRPSEANIIMTQPRRISAIGVADRIANEMNTGRGSLNIFEQFRRSQRVRVSKTIHALHSSSNISFFSNMSYCF